MTIKVFWDDPYLTRLEAVVAAVDGPEVRLDRTIFFAESGGQESDAGAIQGRIVRQARLDGRDIVYRLDDDHGLSPGQPVLIEIDWDRRYRLMRLHFAAEIVLELAYRALGRPEKVGAHIAPDKARIDFAFPENIAPRLPGLEAAANAIVRADQPIESAWDDRENERRHWKIDEFAAVPCGGTHLKRTGEVGRISLKRRNPGKGKERIEIAVE
jgi:Ser-tRNA(Ala) deacylase AlaX